MFRLANQVDELVSDYKWGKWCALVVCHQNDPTLTENDWKEQSADLKLKAQQSQLTTISVGQWKRFPDPKKATRAHKRFDGFGNYDIVVFYRNANRETQYMELLDSNQLDDTLSRLSRQLGALVKSSTNVQSSVNKTEK